MRNLVSSSVKLLFVYIMVLCISSCSQSNVCLEPQLIPLRGGFYYNDTANKHIDTQLVNANIYFGDSSQYFVNLKKISKFSFPLSQIKDTITSYFQSDSNSVLPAKIDTIQLIYARQLKFISVACGYRTNFTLLKTITTRNVIDSVLINSSEVTNQTGKEHLTIVLKN